MAHECRMLDFRLRGDWVEAHAPEAPHCVLIILKQDTLSSALYWFKDMTKKLLTSPEQTNYPFTLAYDICCITVGARNSYRTVTGCWCHWPSLCLIVFNFLSFTSLYIYQTHTLPLPKNQLSANQLNYLIQEPQDLMPTV